MPLGKTPILQNDLMAEGDNQKYLLFNDALIAIEDADNRSEDIDLSSGNVALTEMQTLRFALFKCSGHTVQRTLTVPTSVGTPPIATNRKLAVRNDGTASITVTHNNSGLELAVPAGETALIYADGTDIISLGGVANSATIPLQDDGVEVVAALSSLNIAGTGYTITNTGGAATITFSAPTAFSEMSDTPADFVGAAGQFVRVNGTEDGLEFGAPDAMTGAEIKAAYEGEADTNAFTDAEKTKLAGVEAGATADMSGAEIKAAYEAEANTNAFTDAEKTKLAGLESSLFLGTFASESALSTAHPAPSAGSFAYVDTGIGSDIQLYLWDDDDTQWVVGGSSGSTETAASIKTKYESNADTNAFTDALLAKLDAIEAGATADQTAAEIEALLDAYYGNTDWRTGGGGGGGSVAVNDEGVQITGTASLLDFVGAGVTVTDNGGGSVTITIPGGGGGEVIADSYTTFDTSLTNLTPVFGGGMIKRNSAYNGPAIRVADVTNTDEQDINFDAAGRVSGSLPYGANTRLIRVYDQWGSDDLIATKNDDIRLVVESEQDEFYTWKINFANSATGLYTATTGADNPAWEVADPVFLIGHQRVNNAGLKSIFGSEPNNGGYMALGLWQEGADLHWRVDGSSPVDWANTNWTNNALVAQKFAVAVGDASQRDGSAYSYFNGTAAGSLAYANPVDAYSDTTRMGLGDKDGLGDPFDGFITELHIFSSAAAATVSEIAVLSDAGAEPETIDPTPAAMTGEAIATELDLAIGSDWRNPSTNLVAGGDIVFNSTTEVIPDGRFDSGEFGGWTVVTATGTIQIYADGTAGPDGIPVHPDGYNFAAPPDGPAIQDWYLEHDVNVPSGVYSMSVKFDMADAFADDGARVGIEFLDRSGTSLAPMVFSAIRSNGSPDVWDTFTGDVVVVPSSAHMVRIRIDVPRQGGSNDVVAITDVRAVWYSGALENSIAASANTAVMPHASYSLISNGAIWGALSATNALDAGVSVHYDEDSGYFGIRTEGDPGYVRYENPAFRPLSGADFDYVVRANLIAPKDSFGLSGVFVQDSVSGANISFGIFYTGEWAWQEWNGDTFSSETAIQGRSGPDGEHWSGYIRINRTGDDLTFSTSLDGVVWEEIVTVPVSATIGDITRAGLAISSGSVSSGRVCASTAFGWDSGPQPLQLVAAREIGFVAAADTYRTTTTSAPSTSSFAAKGTTFTPTQDRYLMSVAPDFTATGQTVKAVVAKLDSANPGTITEIVAETPEYTPPSGEYALDFSEGVLLLKDTPYAIIIVRTDGVPSTALELTLPSALPDSNEYFTYGASVQYATTDPQVADNTFFEDTSHVRMVLNSVSPNTVKIGQMSGREIAAKIDDWLGNKTWRTGSTTQVESSAAYTVSDEDLAGVVIRRMNLSSAGDVTVPAGLTNKEPVTFIQTGAGQLTFVADTGVTILSADGNLKTRVQYSSATLVPDGDTADTYYLIGDLAA